MSNYEDDNIKVLSRDGNIGDVAAWKCLCKNCGRIFTTKGANVRLGYTRSCGCIHSINEQKIINMLQEHDIQFSTQYTFPDLVGIGGGLLRFDFAIFENNKLKKLIEFNGLQHYIVPAGSWAKSHEALIENDRRKIEYCINNNINLKIIKYDEEYNIYDLIE